MDANILNNLLNKVEVGEEEFDWKVYLYIKVIEYSKLDPCLSNLAEKLYYCICNDTI